MSPHLPFVHRLKTFARLLPGLFGRVTVRAAVVGAAALLALAGILLWANPLPPASLRIATGANATSTLAGYAKRYKAHLGANGVRLDILASKGNYDNLQMLKQGKADVAFVLGGVSSVEEIPGLVSLGSLYYDPIWVFQRKRLGADASVRNLKGRRINVGSENSGIRYNATKILALYGIDAKNSDLRSLSARDAYEPLNRGELDAVFLAAPPESELLQKYLADPDLLLAGRDDVPVIAARLPHLQILHIPVGLIDPAHKLPAQAIDVVASTMTLLARADTHSAHQYLLMDALRQVHGNPTILGRKGEFPADKDIDFPLSETAEHYLKSGAPFLQRHFPFWLATLLDRFLLVILPVLIVAFPFFKLLPAVYGWSMRSRLYRCYARLLHLEAEITRADAPLPTADALLRLAAIERQLNDKPLPLAFSSERYILKEHIDLVRRSIRDRAAANPPDSTEKAPLLPPRDG